MTTIKRYSSARAASYAQSAQSNSSSPKGSINNPYTMSEFNDFENGTWPGGYVEGLGYVAPDVNIWGSHSSSSDPDSWGSDASDPWGSDTSDPWGSNGSHANPGNTGGGGGGTAGGGKPGGITTGGNSGNQTSKSSDITLDGKYAQISQYSRNLLYNLKGYKGKIYITSVARTPEEQARAMLNNIKKNGVDSQIRLYANPGDNVIRVYNPNLSDEQNLAAMIAQIYKEGPGNVSHHCADTSVLNVVDISISKLSDVDAFLEAVEAEKQKGTISYILERNNGCVHIEIPQP